MNILNNEKVREYFGDCGQSCDKPCSKMADSILTAMQQPIKKGERCLEIFLAQLPLEIREINDRVLDGFHPNYLRLPDRFQPSASVVQKKECPNLTVQCSCGLVITHPDIDKVLREQKPAPEPCNDPGCLVLHTATWPESNSGVMNKAPEPDRDHLAREFNQGNPSFTANGFISGPEKCDELRHLMGYKKCPGCPDDKPSSAISSSKLSEAVGAKIEDIIDTDFKNPMSMARALHELVKLVQGVKG